jgi:glutamate-1-semialdehyde aminotransferase
LELVLQNPVSTAHLEELKDRLFTELKEPAREERVETLVAAVRAMDRGLVTAREAAATFARLGAPSALFGRWLVDMVDEGVYLEAIYNDAA